MGCVLGGKSSLELSDMIDSGRLARAVWLRAQPISGGFLVTGGVGGHVVEIVAGRAYCDCIDATVRGDGCKHALLVRLLGGDKAVALALRQLVPQPAQRTRVTA